MDRKGRISRWLPGWVRVVQCASVVLLVLSPVVAGGQTIDNAVARGRLWLLSQQDPAGRIATVPQLASRDSAIAALALIGAPSADGSIDRTLLYLAGAPEEAAEPRALRALALATAGRNAAPLLDSLPIFLNGGGLGAVPGHQSNHHDTAWWIRALAVEEEARLLQIVGLVDHLTTHQGADGGWGFAGSEASHPYFTARVLLALARLERLAVSADVISRAVTYLEARRQPDGGYGSVVETAVALRALGAAGADPAATAPTPIDHLLAAQAADGSWEGDVLTTAEAILALGRVLPDLEIVGLSSAPPTPVPGDTITLTATVANRGTAPAAASTLAVHLGSADGLLQGEATVQPLAVGETAAVTMEVQLEPSPGRVAFFAVADAGSEIAELDEDDNVASIEVRVISGPDLALYASDLAVSPPQPEPDEPFDLLIGVRNQGETTIGSFLYRVSEPATGAILAEGTAGPAEPGVGALLVVPLSLAEGEHLVEVVIDPEGAHAEIDETNNRAERSFFVVDSSLPDLAIAEADLAVSPERPVAGDPVTITATVRNLGQAAADAAVELWLGEPGAATPLVARQAVSVPPGGSATVTADFVADESTFAVIALADPDEAVRETEESNNRAHRFLLDLPDLAIGYDGIEVAPAAPLDGEAVEIRLTVRNAGTLAATDLPVELWSGDPGQPGSVLVGQATLADLPSAANRSVAFAWTALGGRQDMVAVLDSADVVRELSESNNRASRRLAVPRSAGPNLRVAAVDLGELVHDPATLALSGAVAVEITNDGDAAAAGGFLVRLFEDRDGDGRFAAPDRELAVGPVVADLAAGASTQVLLPVDTSAPFFRPLLWAEGDASDRIAERREDDNLAPLFAACDAPPPPASFEPVEEWWLPGLEVESVPAVVQLSDDDGDGAIDSRDVPDVVFHTEIAGARAITARSGLDGSELWTVRASPGLPIAGRTANLTAADLDGDGIAEVIGLRTDSRLVAVDHRGIVLWTSDPVEKFGGQLWAGGPAVGDLDGDGVPEIAIGRAVLSNRGKLLAIGTANVGRNQNFYGPFGAPYLIDAPLSAIADVDLDGRAELIAGDAVYRLVDGRLEVVWDRTVIDKLMVDGFVAVGQLDADPEAEIVYVSSNKLMVLHHDGTVAAGPVQVRRPEPLINLYTFWAGAPSLGDLDGDGVNEILVSAHRQLVAFRANLSVLWRIDTTELSEMTAAVPFDLDGDGAAEVLALDQTTFRILDGATGATLHSRPNTSKTATEYPIVADVDGDGRAEILVPSNRSFAGDTSTQGLHVLGHPSWSGTRPIWAGHTFHGTNVGLDGTVPSPPPPSWRHGVGFRTNVVLPPPPRRLANPTIGLPRVGRAGADGAPVVVRVGNGGGETLPPGVAVALYAGDPAAALPVAESATAGPLRPGTWEDVVLRWQAAGDGGLATAVVDPYGAIEECADDDNRVSVAITEQLLPDLSIPTGDVVVDPPHTAGRRLPVRVTVANTGVAHAAPALLRLHDGEPGARPVLAEGMVPGLAPGSEVEVPLSWDAPLTAGSHTLVAVVDADDLLPEEIETNNRGLAVVELAAPTRPDLSVERFEVSPAEVAAGAEVLFTAEVRNRGLEIPEGATVSFRVNGAEIDRVISPGRLTAGEARWIMATISTLGRSGTLLVEAVADPAAAVTEEDETNNRASATLRVTGLDASLSIATDRLSYAPDATLAATVTAANAGGDERAVRLTLTLVDSAGAAAAVVADQPLTLTTTPTQLQFGWPLAGLAPGPYSLAAELRDGSSLLARAVTGFSIGQETRLTATVFTDRGTYEAGQTALLSARVDDHTLGGTLTGHTAVLRVLDTAGGEVMRDARNLPVLYPGSQVAIEAQWTIGAAPPGTYVVELAVRDPFQVLVAYASAGLAVGDSSSGAGLTGRLAVTPRLVGAGAPLAALVELAHGGNTTLPDLDVRVDLFRLDDGSLSSTTSAAVPLAPGETASLSLGLTTAGLTAGDYLAVLVAVLPGSEKVLDRRAVTIAPGVSAGDAAVVEGDSGSSLLVFPITLSVPLGHEVTVSWTAADGTAVREADYLSAAGTVTFAPGETSAQVTLAVLGDGEAEPDESVLLLLFDPVGAVLGDAEGFGLIVSDEGCPSPNLLANAGAEEEAVAALAGWQATAPGWERRLGAPAPLVGQAAFAFTGAATSAELVHEVSLTPFGAAIAAGGQEIAASVLVRTGLGDAARFAIDYLDADGSPIDSFDSGDLSTAGAWQAVVDRRDLPSVAASARVRLLAADLDGDGAEIAFDEARLQTLGTRTASVAPAEIVEGDSGTRPAAFSVHLSCPATDPVSVDFITFDGTAIAGADYVAASGSLAIPSGGVDTAVEVAVVGDTLDEPDEHYVLTIASADVVVLGSPTSGTIRDDDGEVSAFVSAVDAAEGAGEVVFTVALSAPTGKLVRVSYATANGTAVAGADYRAASGVVELAPGEQLREIAVELVDDQLDELGETFVLRLSAPQAAVLGAAEASATIFDDDEAALAAGDVVVLEGDSGVAVAHVPITLSVPSTREITVAYTTESLEATAGEDFESVSGTVAFAPGQTATTVVVEILGDTLVEPIERLRMTLATPTNATLADPEGIVSILDNDGVLLSVADLRVREETGNAVFTVSLSKAAPAPVTVAYQTVDGSAVAGADYLAAAAVLSVAKGATSATISVPLVNDLASEPLETFVLELSDPTGALLLDASAEATIVDADGWQLNRDARVDLPTGCIIVAPEIAQRIGSAWRDQPLDIAQSFDKTFRVHLGTRDGGGGDGMVFVVQAAGLTAIGNGGASMGYRPIAPSFGVEMDTVFNSDLFDAPVDHLAIQLHGAHSHNSASPPVPATPDSANIEDGQEHLLRVVWNAPMKAVDAYFDGVWRVSRELDLVEGVFTTGAPIYYGFTAASGTPINHHYFCETAACHDEASLPLVSIGDAWIDEGSTGSTAHFPVTLACPSAEPVEVAFSTADGTALAGADYIPTGGTVTFQPGETSAHVAVEIVGDLEPEPDETFFVELSPASGGEVHYARGTGTIRNEDIGVSIDPLRIVEASGRTRPARLRVALSLPAPESLTFDVEAIPGSAVFGEDFLLPSSALTFAAGETELLLPLDIVGDDLGEGDETFRVRLTSNRPWASSQDIEVFVLDDDDCPSPNLLVNGGFEAPAIANGIAGWQEVVGTDWRLSTNGEFEGAWFVWPGTVPSAELRQDVDVSNLAAWIDRGEQQFALHAMVASLVEALPRDSSRIIVEFLGTGGELLASHDTGEMVNPKVSWRLIGDRWTAPVGTRTIGIRLLSQRYRGSANDGYYDEVVLRALRVPGIAASAVSVTEGMAGPRAVEVPITLTCASPLPVGFDYFTADGTATAGADYVAASGTVAVAPGEIATTVSLTVLGDTLDEGAEELRLVLARPQGAFLSTSEAVVTILDDEATLAVADAADLEGQGAERALVFVVTLSSSLALPVTVAWATADGTATAGEDYAAAAGTLVFQPGETLQEIRVLVYGDEGEEADETFFVRLSEPSNAGIVDGEAVGTIFHDDLSITVADATAVEGAAGTTRQATFRVSLSTPSSQTVRFDYRTEDDLATSGSDYQSTAGTFSLAPGVTEQSLVVTVLGDDELEPSETFRLLLSNPQHARLVQEQAAGIIVDDDDCAGPNLLINGSGDEALVAGELPGWSEAVGTTWTRRTSSPTPHVGSAYFSPGTAAAAELVQDIDVSAYSLYIDRGTQRFLFEGFLRSAPEASPDPGRIVVEYRDAANVEILGTNDSGELASTERWQPFVELLAVPAETRWIRIRLIARRTSSTGSNDAFFDALGLRSLGIPVVLTDEPTSREGLAPDELRFDVRLSCPARESARFAWSTADGTARAGEDYQTVGGEVAFAPGEQQAFLAVPVFDDLVDEGAETVRLELSAPEGVVLQNPSLVGTILDDDAAPILTVTGSRVAEGDGEPVELGFTLRLTSPAGDGVAIDYRTLPGTARAGSDYTATTGRLVFPPGAVEAIVRVPILGDLEDEPDEHLYLALSLPAGLIVLDAPAIGWIADDDDDGLCVGPDLVVNGGFETAGAGVAGWTMVSGGWTRRGLGDSPGPIEGSSFLYPGPVATAEVAHVVDLGGYAATIDADGQVFELTSHVASIGTDRSRVLLDYMDATGAVLAAFDSGEISAGSAWRAVVDQRTVPQGTRSARIRLLSTRLAGSENNGYHDAVSLRSLGTVVAVPEAAFVAENAGEPLTLPVRLSCGSPETISIPYVTGDLTATAGADYLASTGELIVAPFDTEAAVAVVVVDDLVAEGNEALRLVLSDPQGTLVARSEALGTIVDDEAVSLDLATCIDGSGSMSLAEFALQLEGLARAIETVLPHNGTVRLSVLQFAFSSTVSLAPTVITADNYAAVAAHVRSIQRISGGTNIDSCIRLAGTTLQAAYPPSLKRVLDVSTDGAETNGNARAASTAVVNDGIDVVNAIGVGGGISLPLLNDIVHPQPAGGAEGFVILVSTFDQYVEAMQQKVRRETAPDLVVAKTDGRETAVPGESHSYTITVDNQGSGTVTAVRVVDPLPALLDVTWALSHGAFDPSSGVWSGLPLETGATVTLVASGRIDPAATGELVNVVTVHPPDGTADFEPADNTATDTTVLVPSADLALVKERLGPAVAGAALGYRLTVTNLGPSTAAAPVEIVDILPEGTSFLTAGGDGWTCASEPPAVRCRLDSPLAPAAASAVTIAVAVAADAPPEVVNSATVSSPTPDAAAANDTASDRADVLVPRLQVSKLAHLPAGVEAVAPGDEVVYEVVVANGGDATVTAVVLEDPLPAGTRIVAGSIETTVGVVAGEEPLRVEIGDLAAGASATVGFRLLVDLDLPAGTESIANQAVVSSTELPPVPSDDPALPGAADPTAVAVAGDPDLVAEKIAELVDDRDGDGVPSPGDEIAYRIEVTNRGNASATAVVLTDSVPAQTAIVAGSLTTDHGTVESEEPVRVALGDLARGAMAAIAFRVLVDDPVPAGVDRITNQGFVASAELPVVPTDDPALAGDADPTVTAIAAAPVLVAEKTASLADDADLDGVPSPGDALEYLIRVLNTGNTSATAVTVHDQVPEHTTLVPGSIVASQGSVASGEPLEVQLGEIAGGASAEVRFRIRIAPAVPATIASIANQGLVTSTELNAVPTDDPGAGGAADPTVTALATRPALAAEKTAVLHADEDGDGVVSPGDVLLYRIVVRSIGNTDAAEVVFRDALPDLLVVEPGSVQAMPGSVVSEAPLVVELGTLAAGGEGVVTLRARIADPFPIEHAAVVNQGVVEAPGLGLVPTDDPSVDGEADPTRVPVSITPTLTVADITVGEGDGTAAFHLELSQPSNRPIRVAYATADDTAHAGTDYTAAADELLLPAGATEALVEIELIDDLLDELDESFELRIGAVEGAIVGRAAAFATVLDDDPPPVLTVAGGEPVEGDDGAHPLIFRLTLSAPSGLETAVSFATADGTATAPDDYLATSGVAVFPPGATEAMVEVSILGDRLDEDDEELLLVLGEPSGLVLAAATATGVIRDDDLAHLSIGDVEVGEGDDGTVLATFPLSLSLASARPITASWTAVAGTAQAGADFVPTAGEVTFPAGETSATLAVGVVGDRLDEDDETFRAELSSPSTGGLADGVGVATIRDDDPEPVVSIASAEVVEGDAGTTPAILLVQLSTASGRTVEVGWTAEDGTATAGDDYLVASGIAVFPEGTTTADVSVAVVGDRADEDDERFAVELAAPVNAALGAARAEMLIRDDDVPRASIGDAGVDEGDDGTRDAVFDVTLDIPGRLETTVPFSTAEGSARAGADFETTQGSVHFAAGETAATVAVPVVGDRFLEPDETFRVILATPSYGEIGDGEAIGTIRDDERCIGPELVINGSGESWPVLGQLSGWTVHSGGAWTRRTGAPAPVEGVAYLAAGQGSTPELAQDVDLTAFAASIDAGEQRFAFAARLATADSAPAAGARVVVELLDAAATTVLDAYDSGELATLGAWVTLVDERAVPPGTRRARLRLQVANPAGDANAAFSDGISLRSLRVATLSVADVATYEIELLQHDVHFPVRLACPVEHEVRASYATSDGTATAGDGTAISVSDYVAAAGELTIASGETETSVPVTIVGDEDDEPHETFFLDLSNVLHAVPLDPRGEGTILNDDACSRSPGFWKNHRSWWPVEELVIGDRLYGDAALMAFLGSDATDPTLMLARHLVATELSLLQGSDPWILETVVAAHAFLVAHPPGSAPQGEAADQALALKDRLDAYNRLRCKGDRLTAADPEPPADM